MEHGGLLQKVVEEERQTGKVTAGGAPSQDPDWQGRALEKSQRHNLRTVYTPPRRKKGGAAEIPERGWR